ncbi:MAG TPA: lipoate--protein ligase [Clostridiaceae bacterium]|nr:lipoate--protein ligase [Clostridiaceae bacterium]
MSGLIKIITTDIQNPWINLALEEYLLINLKKNEVVLFLWQNKDTVVIGRNQNPWSECNLSLMEDDNIRLARRITGGGAVFHDIGNLNFSFILSRDKYDVGRQCNVIINGLKKLGINAVKSGRNDMTVDGKKFSGNAFGFRGNNALHHGTILIGADKEKMSRYLTVSYDKIKTKGVASVKSRVTNLSDIMPGITVEVIKEAVIKAFTDEYGKTGEIVNFMANDKDMWPKDAAFRNIMARNSSWEWRFGETPDFDIYLKNRFSWGGIELYFKLDEGIISKAEIYSDALCEEIITALPELFINLRFVGKELSQKLIDSKGTLSGLLKDRDSEDMVLNDLAVWLSKEL